MTLLSGCPPVEFSKVALSRVVPSGSTGQHRRTPRGGNIPWLDALAWWYDPPRFLIEGSHGGACVIRRRHRPVRPLLLRRYRLDAGLTQGALAEQAGVSARTIQHLEAGMSQPQADTTHRLSAALGLEAEARASLPGSRPAHTKARSSPRGQPGARRRRWRAPIAASAAHEFYWPRERA